MKADWKTFLIDAGAEFDGERLLHYGNPERERRVAMNGPVFCDLEYLGVIAAHGADAAAFLHAQLSNDVLSLGLTDSRLAAFCTPKGRMLGLLRLFRQGDSWYLRLPRDTLEGVLQRLRMFILRAQVTLEDASDNFLRIGASGNSMPEEMRAITGEPPASPGQVTQHNGLTVIRVPGTEPRYELYINAMDQARRIWNALNVDCAPVGEDVWRLLEIRAGIPAVFSQTVEQFVPQMVNLERLDGISFKKGCYPGQEIVARMQYLGTLKRRMYAGHIDSDVPPLPGSALYTHADPQQAAGHIVDAQPHPDGGCLALAVVRIEAMEGAGLHLDSGAGPVFRPQPLPYPLDGE